MGEERRSLRRRGAGRVGGEVTPLPPLFPVRGDVPLSTPSQNWPETGQKCSKTPKEPLYCLENAKMERISLPTVISLHQNVSKSIGLAIGSGLETTFSHFEQTIIFIDSEGGNFSHFCMTSEFLLKPLPFVL